MSREPETEAGRRLARNLGTLNLADDPESLWAEHDILRIEAEAVALYRKDLAEKVRALPVAEYDTGETVFVDREVVSRSAVLRLIEGSDHE